MADDPETAHEKMRRHDELSGKAHQFEQQKLKVRDELTDILTAALQDATAETGVDVDLVEVNDTGEKFTFRPRFDFGAFVTEAEEQLPPAFHIDTFHEDGALTVVWTEHGDEPADSVEVTAVLEGIIRERTIESEYMIEESPTSEEVLDAATTFGLDRDEVAETLDRMIELGSVDTDENGNVWMT